MPSVPPMAPQVTLILSVRLVDTMESVWNMSMVPGPEHLYQSSCHLMTLESSVALNPGDSYYLPTDVIHDVEFDAKVAVATPAVTLFLASEAVVVPHVYMAQAMAEWS